MKYFLFIVYMILVVGCVRKNQVPGDIIPQNEMRKIMWDLMRADAYVSDFIMKDSTRDQKKESALFYAQVFDIHATTPEAFKKSMAFYESRPDLLKTITDSLRSDEKKVQSYEDYKRPRQAIDTTTGNPKLNKKILQNKQ